MPLTSMLLQLQRAGLLAQRRLDCRVLSAARRPQRSAAEVLRHIYTKERYRSKDVRRDASREGTVLEDAESAASPADDIPGMVNWKRLDMLMVFFRGATMGWEKQRVSVLTSAFRRPEAVASHCAAFFDEYTAYITRTTPKDKLKPVPLKGLKAQMPNPCPLLNVVNDPNFVDWFLGFAEAQEPFVIGPVAPFFRLSCNDNLLYQLEEMTFKKFNFSIGHFHPRDMTYSVTDPRELRIICAMCDGNLRLSSSRTKFAAWVEAFNRTYPALAWEPAEEAVQRQQVPHLPSLLILLLAPTGPPALCMLLHKEDTAAQHSTACGC